jgi:hypothetical protein
VEKLYQVKIASGDIIAETHSWQEAEEVVKTKLSKRPIGSRLYITTVPLMDFYTYEKMACGVRECSTPPVGANF